MKRALGFILTVTTIWTFAQTGTQVRHQLASASGSENTSATLILSSANYILTHPVDSLDETRNEAMGSVLLWMYNTPDFVFFIDETILPFIEEDAEVLAIYMVAMAQYVLENPEMADNKDEVKLQAFSRLLTYCDSPLNKIKKSKTMSRAIYAMRTGWLKEYLKIT